MALKDTFTKNLKQIRLEQHLTQQELAEKSGLDVRYISRLENRPQSVRLDILERVAAGLGVTPSKLIIEENIPDDKKQIIAEIEKTTELLLKQVKDILSGSKNN